MQSDWSWRSFARKICCRQREQARSAEYQQQFQDGLRHLDCTDGLEYWTDPWLRARAPLLFVSERDPDEGLMHGELELIVRFRDELLKGVLDEDEEEDQGGG